MEIREGLNLRKFTKTQLCISWDEVGINGILWDLILNLIHRTLPINTKKPKENLVFLRDPGTFFKTYPPMGEKLFSEKRIKNTFLFGKPRHKKNSEEFPQNVSL